jgi:hypothetical protein
MCCAKAQGREIVRDNMGHVEYRRDPESLQQEMMGRASGCVCRNMYAPTWLRQIKQKRSSSSDFRSQSVSDYAGGVTKGRRNTKVEPTSH